MRIDTQGPVVTPIGLQPDEHSGWRQTAQTVSLTADDAGGTGVTAIYFTVDGGATQTYAGDFSVSGIGEHPVVYWATDPLGNESPHRTGWVNISNPYAQASGLANDDHSGWRNTAQTVTITADGDHQPLTVHYRVDGGTWQTAANPASFTVSAQGTHAVDYYANNTVAVESPHQTGYVNIDTVTPTTTAGGLQANNHTGWTTTAPTVTLSASDALSGVSATRYTVDGGAAQTYAGPFTVSAPGSHAIAYWSVDAAGNAEATHTGYVNIDTTAPVTSATGLQPDSESGWITTTQSVTLTPADGESGVAATYYTVDGGDQQTYAWRVHRHRRRPSRGRVLVGRRARQHRGDEDRLRQHRCRGRDDDRRRPAGQRHLRLAQQRADGDAERRRPRRLRRLRAALHDRRRRDAGPTPAPSASPARAATRWSTGRSTSPATSRRRTPATSTSTSPRRR